MGEGSNRREGVRRWSCLGVTGRSSDPQTIRLGSGSVKPKPQHLVVAVCARTLDVAIVDKGVDERPAAVDDWQVAVDELWTSGAIVDMAFGRIGRNRAVDTGG